MNLHPEFKKSLGRAHLLVRFRWVAFFISVVALLFTPTTVFTNLPGSKSYQDLTEVENTIWLLALAFAGLLLSTRQRFYTVEAMFQASKTPLIIRHLKGESPTEKGAARLVYFYRSRILLTLVYSEIIAICGLLLALIDPYGLVGRLFFLTSLALLVFFYPSRSFFDDLLKEYEHREVMYELESRWGRS